MSEEKDEMSEEKDIEARAAFATVGQEGDSDGQFHLDLKNFDGLRSLPISQALAQRLFTECSPSDPSHYHYDDRNFFDVFQADEDERVGPDDSEFDKECGQQEENHAATE